MLFVMLEDFFWAKLVLSRIAERISQGGDEFVTPFLLSFLKAVLNIFSLVLNNNESTCSSFRQEIDFAELREVLQKWKFIEGPLVMSLCDDLIDVALKGTWPPSCLEHPALIQNQLFHNSYRNSNVNFSENSLERAKELVCNYACVRCEESLLINVPEIFKLIIELFGHAISSLAVSNVNFKMIIEKLNFIVKLSLENQRRLSLVGTLNAIFENFKVELQKEFTEIHIVLLKFIETLAGYHISSLELKQFFSLFSPDGFPLTLLKSLHRICTQQEQHHNSTHAIEISDNDSRVELNLPVKPWPPATGFSLAMWFCIDKFSGDSDIESPLVTFTTDNQSTPPITLGIKDYFINLTLGNLRDSKSAKFVFDDKEIQLKPKRWYHLLISFSPTVTNEVTKRKESKKNFRVYLNGFREATATIPYPKPSGNHSNVHVSFGSKIRPLSHSLQKYDFTLWQLGVTYMFDETPNDYEAFLVYQLGPNYWGSLDKSLHLFQNPYTSLSTSSITRFDEKLNLLTENWKTQLAYWQDKIVFVFTPRHCIYAYPVRVLTVPGTVPIANATLTPHPAVISQASKILHATIRDVMPCVGGMNVMIFLISMLRDSPSRILTIKILQSILHYSSRNFHELKDIHGYELIGRIIRKNNWSLDDPLLEVLFELVGFTQDTRALTYSVGVLTNIYAFKQLLLDWRIWTNADHSVRKQLFESLANIVTEGPANIVNFNISMFREAQVRNSLLLLFQQDEAMLSRSLEPALIKILRAVLEKEPSSSDFVAIYNYLLGTHNNNHSKQATPLISTGNPLLDKGRRQSLGAFSIRTSVIILVTNLIIESDRAFGTFTKYFTIENILGFLSHPSNETRIALLRILEVCLKNKELLSHFTKMQGFYHLGLQLMHHQVTEDLFTALICLLLGYPIQMPKKSQDARRSRAYSTSSIRNVVKPNTSVVLHHPGVIQSVVLLAGSEHCKPKTSYFALKMLLDLFLQSHSVKVSFIEHNIVQLLCDTFETELAHRMKYREAGRWYSPRPIEEQAMLFLRTITVYCCINTRIKILERIIQYLLLLTSLPNSYVISLQQRILYEVLLLFNESDFYVKQRHSATFKEVLKLTMNIHRWERIDRYALFERILNENKDFQGLRMDPPLNVIDSDWEFLYDNCIYRDFEFYQVFFSVLGRAYEKEAFDVLNVHEELSTSLQHLIIHILKSNISAGEYNWRTQSAGSLAVSVDSTEALGVLESKPRPAAHSFELEHSLDEMKPSILVDDISSIVVEVLELDPPIDFASETEISTEESRSDDDSRFLHGLSAKGAKSGVETPDTLSSPDISLSDSNGTGDEPHPIIEEEIQLDSDKSPQKTSDEILEERKANLLKLALSTLVENGLLAFLINKPEFISLLLTYTVSLFHHPNASVRKLTHQLWKIVPPQCKNSLPILSAVITPQVQSYLQTHDPSFSDRAIAIEKYLDIQPLISFTQPLEEKTAKINEEYRRVYIERMHLLLLHTLKRNSTIRSNHRLINQSLSAQIARQDSKLKEISQKTVDHDRHVQRIWKSIVKQLTHDRAIWKIPVHSWKLDPTEGPNRMQKRLKPSIDLPLLYYLTPFQFVQHKSWSLMIKENDLSSSPLISPEMMRAATQEQLMQIQTQRDDVELQREYLFCDMSINEQEPFLQRESVSLISPFRKQDGELLLYDKLMYFLDSSSSNDRANFDALVSYTRLRHVFKWQYNEIKELQKRRYLFKNCAMEIFMITGKTFMLSFPSKRRRDDIYDKILSFDLPNRVDYERQVAGNFMRLSITEKWQRGLISNFEYLMHLNTLAGRTFNDLTQYPVFPYVLSNYESEELDLEDENVYRDLSKPMGALDPERLERFEQKYLDLAEVAESPYYYGTHYSNLGAVLHFSVRLAPFSHYFIEFQDGSFDIADRSFHSIPRAWLNSSKLSMSDLKELIPCFFVMPEFLTNINHYDMGVQQNDERVSQVVLPAWAKSDPRLFIKIHQRALESRYVSENLHNWIDLIFGFKQTGEQAIRAKNMFHPFTYAGIDIDKIENEVEKNAAITQITNYGQTPHQIFTRPHVRRQHPMIPPLIFNQYERLVAVPLVNISTEVGYIMHRPTENNPLILPAKRIPLYPEGSKYISWGHWDHTLLVYVSDSNKFFSSIDSFHDDDEILCASITRNGRVLVAGGSSGVVKIWRKLRDRRSKAMTLKFFAGLQGHSQEILCITTSQEWSIFASGSADKTCIVWDLNRSCLIFSLPHPGRVYGVAISPTSGDIVTLSELNFVCCLTLWSINGQKIAETYSEERLTCLVFSSGMEGLCDNVIFAGGQDGRLYIWSAWDLRFLYKLNQAHQAPISCISLVPDNSQITTGDVTGLVVAWKLKSST